MREHGEKFEVVFVSSDKDREDYDRLTEDMPWWRIDYDDYATLVSHVAPGVGQRRDFSPVLGTSRD